MQHIWSLLKLVFRKEAALDQTPLRLEVALQYIPSVLTQMQCHAHCPFLIFYSPNVSAKSDIQYLLMSALNEISLILEYETVTFTFLSQGQIFAG